VKAAAFSTKVVTPVTAESVGASLTAVRLMVSVWTVLRLNEPEPSLSSQVTGVTQKSGWVRPIILNFA